MTDLADYAPGPDCLAAREKLLEGIMATWKQPKPKQPRPAAAPPPDTLIVIDIAIEKEAVGRLYVEWQKELAAKRAICEVASRDKTNPGDNYWLPEAKAKARWIVAANFVEMLEAAHR